MYTMIKEGTSINMKLFAFSLREYDEKQYMDAICEKLGIEYRYTPDYPSDENLHLCEGCDCVSIITSITDKPLLDKLYALGVRYIATRSIGYEHIDVAYAHQLGMKVSNVGYAPESVANYAIMLMLMCCRNITHILKRADLQDYSLREKIGRNLSECTVGVIGTGRIGRTVMKHLSGFGCPMLAYDLVENEEAAALGRYVDLDTLLRESDIITLHAPATGDNTHMIDDEAIAKMKPGAILINTARGPLVDSDALIRGLESGKIGAAGLDVIEHEAGLYYLNRMNQPIANHDMAILRSFPNVVITPHTAFYTHRSVRDMVENTVKGLYAFANGQENPFEVK